MEIVISILRMNCVEIVVLELVVIRVLELDLTKKGVKEKYISLIIKTNKNWLSSILKVVMTRTFKSTTIWDSWIRRFTVQNS